ncbi:MAG: HlyD family secretion protein [Colwellia sp.]
MEQNKPNSELSGTTIQENMTVEESSENMKPEKKQDFTKKLTKGILLLSLVYFAWYLIGDRLTPMTDLARVRAFVTPIMPQVSGEIVNIHVGGDRIVKKGEPLFEIDPRTYRYAVEKAESDLELASQNVGADVEAVIAAKANFEKAKSDLIAKEANTSRILAVAAKGVVSKSEADRARGILAAAQQNVVNTEATYRKAQQLLGKEGKENAKVRNAISALSDAQLNLDRTIVVAPSDGVVSYAKADVGYYASVGSKVMTFISTDAVWIEASYRENNLGNIKQGDPVDIVLDAAPGSVYKGNIVSVGYGVSFDNSVQGELPTAQKSTGWMREPQRFIVVIKLDTSELKKNTLREGGQADVITYTSNNFVINALGKLWIHIKSILTYVS